jgi:uncharacterized membrane protein
MYCGYCGKCGAQIPADNSFCGKCGYKCEANFENPQNSDKTNEKFKGDDFSKAFDPGDAQTNKVAALLAYPLFFIPLIIAPNSKFARFHANQGLIVFIFALLNSILQNIFRVAHWGSRGWGWFLNWSDRSGWIFSPFSIITNIIGVLLIAAIIYGIVNAANGKAVEIPLIGKFRIIT